MVKFVKDTVTIIVGPDSVDRALKEIPFLNETHLRPAFDPGYQVFVGGRMRRPYLLRVPFNQEARAEFMKRKEIEFTMPLKEFTKLAKQGKLPESLKNAFDAALKQTAQIEIESKEDSKLGFEDMWPVTRAFINLLDRTIGTIAEEIFTNTKQSPVKSIAIEEVDGYNQDATLTITKYDWLQALFC